MKKLLVILSLAAGLLIINTQNAVAQTNETITTKAATKDKGYTLLNPSEAIKIYKYAHPSHSPKETEKYAPKYFFVIEGSDVLQELTKMNLKKAYPENHGFHDALDTNFKEDKELTSYDEYHKMYKINWILKNNMK